MPVMNGFEASRRIRQFEREYYDAQPSSKPSWHPTTIAALTGLDSPHAEQEAFASGIDIFLTKPISREKVLSLLERCNLP
jgi:CheY-like chemotaxis protein